MYIHRSVRAWVRRGAGQLENITWRLDCIAGHGQRRVPWYRRGGARHAPGITARAQANEQHQPVRRIRACSGCAGAEPGAHAAGARRLHAHDGSCGHFRRDYRSIRQPAAAARGLSGDIAGSVPGCHPTSFANALHGVAGGAQAEALGPAPRFAVPGPALPVAFPLPRESLASARHCYCSVRLLHLGILNLSAASVPALHAAE